MKKHIEVLIMNKNKIKILLCLMFIFISCGKKEERHPQSVEQKNDNVLIEKEYCSYEILKHNFISGDPSTISYIGPQHGIIINSAIFPYDRLQRYEPDAFSPGFSNFIRNEKELSYEKVMNYFSENVTNDFVLLSNVRGYYEPDSKKFVEGSRNFLILDGSKVGEYAVSINNSDSNCYITYEFLIIGKDGLISADVMLKCSAFDIQIPNPSYFEYYAGQLEWKSPSVKKEFYDKLEGADYKKLPSKIVLLKDSKELFLKSFKVKK